MLTAEVFRKEMKRLRTPDGRVNALGLHLPVWMQVGGDVDPEHLSALYGVCSKDLRDDEDLIRFVDFLLLENAAGKLQYFPKVSEMKSAIQRYCASIERPVSRPVFGARSWVAPSLSEQQEKRKAETLEWWGQLSAEDREVVKNRILQDLLIDGEVFAATYLENRVAAWDRHSPGPIVIANLMAFRVKYQDIRPN